MRALIPTLIATTLLAMPAQAVIILDSTWEANGGGEGALDQGFDAHFALAAEPQFAGIVGLWNEIEVGGYGGSATWIGNDDEGYAYIITAAHNFGDGTEVDDWIYYTRDEQELNGVELWIHPQYDDNSDETGGWDMAIVKLDGPIEGAGPVPLLYGGSDELGRVATITGYGMRGIGSEGEDNKFYADEVAAAARNVIDEVDGENGENVLVIDFDSEAGDANVLPGDAEPVDELEGILGSGDSGGATWIEAEGAWAIAGINAWGDDSVYGSISAMARVSTQRKWIESIFPGAQFTN